MRYATKIRIILFVALSLIILILSLSYQFFLTEKITTETKASAKIETIQVKERWLSNIVVLPGLVTSSKNAIIISRTGGKVTKVYVKVGDKVLKNQPLIEIDMSSTLAALSEAESREKSAQVAYNQAEHDYLRYQTLLKAKAVSPKEFEEVRNQYDIAKNTLGSTKSLLDAAKHSIEYNELRSPFDGVVNEKNVNEGDIVSESSVLLKLNGGSLEAETEVNEEIFNRIKLDMMVQVVSHREITSGKIIEISDTADPSTHTHFVKLELSKGISLNSGDYINLNFKLGESKGLAVPNTAIVKRSGLMGVFVVDDQDNLHFRMVRSGEEVEGYTKIISGLIPGEYIILNPTLQMKNGMHINSDVVP